MMTKVFNLEEIQTAIPITVENPRRFNVIIDQLMLVNLDSIMAARTFVGELFYPVKNKDGAEQEEEGKRETLVDLWLPTGLCVTTVFTPQLKEQLLSIKKIETPAEKFNKNNSWMPEDDSIRYVKPTCMDSDASGLINKGRKID